MMPPCHPLLPVLVGLALLVAPVAGAPAPGDEEAPLEEASPLEAEVTYLQDYLQVVAGGRERGAGHPRMLDVVLGLDLQPLFGEGAGLLAAEWYALGGSSVSDKAGDLQGVSNAEAERRGVLAELWWERWFLDDHVRLKLGKVDANSEFAFSETASQFLNSSMGFSPTIQSFPTFPDPAWSVNLEWRPDACLSVRAAVYDGAAQEGVATGGHGYGTFLGEPADLVLIGQVDVGWQAGGGGSLGLGAWRHTGTFERFDGGQEAHATGTFLVLDQNLWQEANGASGGALEQEPWHGNRRIPVPHAMGHGNGGERLDLFVQAGLADEALSPIRRHLGAGVRWSEIAEGHSLGFGVSRVDLSSEPGAGFDRDHETALELTWRWNVSERLTLQPDVQYVINPGGERELDNALVVGCRASLHF